MASISSFTTNKSEENASAINILDRLVWIRYESHWWPAILYESYAEVQHHLYRFLDTTLKAQFAMAIMLEMNSNKQTAIARVLGRSTVELVEIDEDGHREFYWKLNKRIERGCDLSRYGGNMDLYIDFHNALDEIVQIFQIYSVKQKFDLLPPDSSYQTWHEAAWARVEELGLSLDNSRDDNASASRRRDRRTQNSGSVEPRRIGERATATANRKASLDVMRNHQSRMEKKSSSKIASVSVIEKNKGEKNNSSAASRQSSGNIDNMLSDLLSEDDSFTDREQGSSSSAKCAPGSSFKFGRSWATTRNKKPSHKSRAVVFE
jgi:hypothetical protein